MKTLLIITLLSLTYSHTIVHAQENNSGLYMGLGYGATSSDLSFDKASKTSNKLLNTSSDSVLLLAGYNVNRYLGVEGRYYLNASSSTFDYYMANTALQGTYKANSLALYAKPQYALGLATLYGLVGVTFNDYTFNSQLGGNNTDSLFSWGGGAKFNVTQSLGLFIDYTDLGQSKNLTNSTLNAWNLGVSYTF